MRLLLDTHVFLWYITADPRLPATFRAAVQDPANEVYLTRTEHFRERQKKQRVIRPVF